MPDGHYSQRHVGGLPLRTPGRAHAAEVGRVYDFQHVRTIARARVPEVSTLDHTPSEVLRYSPDQQKTIAGVTLTAGDRLWLQPGDYFYSHDWINPKPLLLVLTWIGAILVVAGDQFVFVEGEQITDSHVRPRALAVRVSALSTALHHPWE